MTFNTWRTPAGAPARARIGTCPPKNTATIGPPPGANFHHCRIPNKSGIHLIRAISRAATRLNITVAFACMSVLRALAIGHKVISIQL
jgi:hypothetical protein